MTNRSDMRRSGSTRPSTPSWPDAGAGRPLRPPSRRRADRSLAEAAATLRATLAAGVVAPRFEARWARDSRASARTFPGGPAVRGALIVTGAVGSGRRRRRDRLCRVAQPARPTSPLYR